MKPTPTPTPKRGRPRLRPVDQPRDYAVEYASRKAGARKRGNPPNVGDGGHDGMQSPDWRYTLAQAGFLAWASGRPQAIVLHRRYDCWRYDITCVTDAADTVWVVLPPVAMPRLPVDTCGDGDCTGHLIGRTIIVK